MAQYQQQINEYEQMVADIQNNFNTASLNFEEKAAVYEQGFVAMIVISESGKCLEYTRWPLPIEIIDPFFAWGAGSDFAMGAMAAGANAREAVLIANKHENDCGMGIDYYHIVGNKISGRFSCVHYNQVK